MVALSLEARLRLVARFIRPPEESLSCLALPLPARVAPSRA